MIRILSTFAIVFAGLQVQAADLRAEQEVLKDLFIRAGGAGGRRSLQTEILNNLCLEGVSTVFYLYPTESFTTQGEYSCGSHTMTYTGSGFKNEASRPVLEAIYRAAQTNSGPIIAHCWNGWHASGEVAAHALMQFCDWSGDQAAQYWADNIGDKSNLSKYGSITRRISRFTPFGDLQFTAQQKQKYCP